MKCSPIPHGLRSTGMLIVLTLAAPGVGLAQSPPSPVHTTSGLEGAMKSFYRAANVVIVTTMDGVDHVYHFAKDLVVHGGKGNGVDALQGLREGSTVVIHYTANGSEQEAEEVDVIGAEGLKATEGTVTRIDRGRRQITVRYDNGKTELFRLTERAAEETAQPVDRGAPEGTKVIIYYADEHGERVAHFFRRVSK